MDDILIYNRKCLIYPQSSPAYILLQPVDDNDISVLDSEVAKISELSDKPFIFVAFKIEDWNSEPTPWDAPAAFFALWVSYQTDVFSAVAAASPSVWYPGWIDYASDNNTYAERIYLSLGSKEEKTRNKIMSTVGDCIRKQYEILESQLGADNCTLEWNQGNHFMDSDLRCARAFAWCMNT